MGSQARPVFFCTRPNGTLTPLIAMDDLPTHITIRGVTRTITPGETQGMISCGVAVTRAQPWIVDAPGSTVQNANMADAGELVDLLAKIVDEEPVSNNIRIQVQDAIARYMNSLQQAANKPQKEYCSYWIRHGECDYAQQGCLFKHEMPRDPILLARLGLRDIPRWYRDQYGVPSIHEDAHGNYRPQLAITEAIGEQPAMRAIQCNVPNNAIVERNGNGNGNANANAQHRGPNGRYRNPRGVGYPSRGRANHWQRGGNRVMNNNQSSNAGTPVSRSPNTSDQSWTDATPVTGIKNLNMVNDDPQEDGGVLLPAQHIPFKNEPTGRLTFNDTQKPMYRTKSRRPWVKEHDGKHQSPDASPVATEETNGSTISPVKVQAADASNIETATVVNAPTPESLGNSTVTSAHGSTTDAHDDSTVTSVIGSIPNLIDYDPFPAARVPASDPFSGGQLPRSALAEMARNSDPIIGKANRLIWTPIGEPVHRYPFNFGQTGFSNGAEFGW